MEKEYFEILLEEMNSKFSLVLEGQVALLKRVDDVREDLAAKLDHNSRLLAAMDQKLDVMMDKFEGKLRH